MLLSHGSAAHLGAGKECPPSLPDFGGLLGCLLGNPSALADARPGAPPQGPVSPHAQPKFGFQMVRLWCALMPVARSKTSTSIRKRGWAAARCRRKSWHSHCRRGCPFPCCVCVCCVCVCCACVFVLRVSRCLGLCVCHSLARGEARNAGANARHGPGCAAALRSTCKQVTLIKSEMTQLDLPHALVAVYNCTQQLVFNSEHERYHLSSSYHVCTHFTD